MEFEEIKQTKGEKLVVAKLNVESKRKQNDLVELMEVMYSSRNFSREQDEVGI